MTEINSKTQLFCVIGNPVVHSMSPLIHNLAFGITRFNGVYTAFSVTNPLDAVKGIRALGIRGVSVTIPHKVSVMDYLDEIDSTAKEIGAVNTIFNDNGILKGSNTDCDGAVKALLEKTEISNKKVLIFGAGGSARAIGYGVIKNGGDLTITNRTAEKGHHLADFLSCNFCDSDKADPLSYDILINTTSLGMTPNTSGSPVNADQIKNSHVVMDIVYNPIKTRFLMDAEKKGCKTVNGVSMFVNQASLQFRLWTGLKAPYSEMEKKVIEELEKR